ncbi:MAG: hypothetical protein IT383_03770 [Deltaproteobacteria bacterium]|nr:hypothetical protein [Deltaproteobacteria bacterium]
MVRVDPSDIALVGSSSANQWRKTRGSLRTNALPDALTVKAAIRGIGNILRSGVQPEKVSKTDWRAFQKSIKSDDGVQALVAHVEWSVGAPAHADLRGEVEDRLLSLGHAASVDDARVKYQRLFVFILFLLSEDGPKVLTKAGLAEPLSEAPLREAQASVVNAVVSRLDRLEAVVASHDRAIEELVTAQRKDDVRLSIALSPPRLSPPPPLARRSLRKDAVAAIVPTLGDKVWLALHGPAGSGKTELALLVASSLGSIGAWVSFRDLDANQAVVRLNLATSEVFKANPPLLGRGAVLVLDDLPLVGRGEFADRLLDVVRDCSASHVRIITTSAVPPPDAVTARAESVGGSLSTAAPPFTDDEAAELLLSFGMPSAWDRKRISFVRSVVSGHAALLTAVGVHFAKNGWLDDDAFLQAMLYSRFGEELNDETARRLTETVPNAESGELLYRLREAIGEFDFADVQAVADVEVAVAPPRERFTQLLGLWIQRTAADAYVVSPLVKRLGTGLRPETRKRTNAALADALVAKRSLDQWGAARLIGYLLVAEQWDRAGTILVFVLQKAPKQLALNDILFGGWASGALPDGMSAHVKVMIRGLQLQRQPTETQRALYLREIKELFSHVSPENGWALAALMGHPISIIAGRDFALAVRIGTRAAELAWAAHGAGDQGWSRLDGMSSIAFTPLIQSESFADAVTFLDAWGELPLEVRAAHNAAEEIAPRSWQHLARLPWTSRASVAREAPEWATTLVELESLRATAVSLDVPWLRVWAEATIIIVLAEEQKNLAAAFARGEDALREPSLTAEQSLILEECVGRQLLYARENAGAAEWLTRALQRESRLFPDSRVDALLALSHAVSETDPSGAVRAAQDAVVFSKSPQGSVPQLTIKSLGELAIALCRASGPRGAFPVLDDAVQLLIARRQEARDWFWLARLLTQVALWLWHELDRGTVPFAVPVTPGFMLNLSPASTEAIRGNPDDVFTVMANFAESAGFDARAAEYARRALYAEAGGPSLIVQTTSAPKVMAELLRERRLAEALDVALIGSAAFIASRVLNSEGRLQTRSTDTVDAVLGPRNQGEWRRVDLTCAEMFFVPASMTLGEIWLDDPAAGQREALALAALFRQQAVDAAEPKPWVAAAVALEAAFEDVVDHKALVNEANAQGDVVIQAFTFVLATLSDRLPLKDCAIAHREVERWYTATLANGSPMVQRVVVAKFFETYWNTRFRESPALFSAPRLVGPALETASKQPLETRASAILAALLF